MYWKEHIPFGVTGSICYLDNSLPDSLATGEINDFIHLKLTQYYTKNIKQVFLVSSEEKLDTHESIIDMFEKEGLPCGFFRYQSLERDKSEYRRDTEVLDSLLSLTSSSNFAFLFTELETRDIYSFLSKALLYLNPEILPGDIVSYFTELDWEKVELEYLASFQKYLNTQYYLDRETDFFFPKAHIRPLKEFFREQKPDQKILENLIITQVNTDKSFIQNEDGSFKKIEFNLSSLEAEEESRKDPTPINPPQTTSEETGVSNVEPVFLSEEESQETSQDLGIPLPDENIGQSNIYSVMDQDFKSQSIDSLLDTIKSDIPIDKTIPNLNTSQLDEIINLETTDDLAEEKKKASDNLIDTDSLIDLDLEGNVTSSEVKELPMDEKIKPNTETEEVIPSFDIHSLITNEIGKSEAKVQEKEQTNSEQDTQNPREKESLTNPDGTIDGIESLIGEELEIEDKFDEGDFILDPAETNIDLLIEKEISDTSP